MPTLHGTNLTNVKEKNRALALRLISTGQSVSRANLARSMHLTKTTLGNIVSDLIASDIIKEYTYSSSEADSSLGRKPIILDLSPNSPLIMGMLIKRNLLSGILADLKGRIIDQKDFKYDSMDKDTLIETLVQLFEQLRKGQSRKIIAIGISSIGPVDTKAQKLTTPVNFWGIQNLPLPEIIRERTGLPAYIIHDSSAGALAEKIYGSHTYSDNLLYLHIMNGVGAGYIFQGNIYDGDFGQSGELGHTSINFAGPSCNCGNRGCLELYANIENMNRHIQELRMIYKGPTLLSGERDFYSWSDIITAASAMDFLAMAALDEFCGYLAYAVRNAIHLLDVSHIIVGYDSPVETTVVEDTLTTKLNSGPQSNTGHIIEIVKSSFGGQAPLIGSIAVVTDKIFNGELNIVNS
ncbi:ROK family protein [Acetatifactor aquisgranensis]|uniref:ROK family protein n=1 Tax=Acetatifactor aquisgranensis TaxID=2941233 RepID=UPI00203E6001|nr:ROK family protein [Acetatifactor aquisgranensis]